ncbi:MAG: twin-arginine translocase subunit TatC [Schleiferiaceae bacterium]|jgi:sec-independent protein translocase protein TatC|nr:twin-arginine translocase subunit TatC [Schleiferiaceae bacterium]
MEQTKKNKNSLSFIEHLEELRWHLVRSAVAIMVLAGVAFSNPNIVFDNVILGLTKPDFISYRLICELTSKISTGVFCFETMPFEIINMKMAGQFSMHIWVSIVAGLIVAFPYVLWELWRFIQPGLRPEERKNSKYVISVSTFLFLTGVFFGYFVISPLSVQFLGTYSISESVTNRLDLSSYISTITSITLASGILFELPIIVFFLSKLGLVTPDLMRKYRKHALVVILILSAIITPPDMSSQILVSIPVLLLYEISIRVSARVEKRLAREAEAL